MAAARSDDKAAKLLKCDGCKSVLYYSEACQRAHWPEHKRVCRRLQRKNAANAVPTATIAREEGEVNPPLTSPSAPTP